MNTVSRYCTYNQINTKMTLIDYLLFISMYFVLEYNKCTYLILCTIHVFEYNEYSLSSSKTCIFHFVHSTLTLYMSAHSVKFVLRYLSTLYLTTMYLFLFLVLCTRVHLKQSSCMHALYWSTFETKFLYTRICHSKIYFM